MYKKAIRAIKNINFVIENNLQEKDAKIYISALNTAIEAMKMRTPTKPNHLQVLTKTLLCGCCTTDYNSGTCPHCGEDVTDYHAFCGDCGQALDWGDEDD